MKTWIPWVLAVALALPLGAVMTRALEPRDPPHIEAIREAYRQLESTDAK